jgi:hypothetical protein
MAKNIEAEKATIRFQTTLDTLEAQIEGCRREIAAGGKVGPEGQKFEVDLKKLISSDAWGGACW